MRPQHITAENRVGRSRRGRAPPGFNEAAAYHCGKLDLGLDLGLDLDALQ